MTKYILLNSIYELSDIDRKAHALSGYATRAEAIKARGKTNKLIVKATFDGGVITNVRTLKA